MRPIIWSASFTRMHIPGSEVSNLHIPSAPIYTKLTLIFTHSFCCNWPGNSSIPPQLPRMAASGSGLENLIRTRRFLHHFEYIHHRPDLVAFRVNDTPIHRSSGSNGGPCLWSHLLGWLCEGPARTRIRDRLRARRTDRR